MVGPLPGAIMDRVYFKVNGIVHSVGCEEDSDTSLNDYLRRNLNLRGVKNMCQEGGCGACIVAVTVPDGCDQRRRTFSVNSVILGSGGSKRLPTLLSKLQPMPATHVNISYIMYMARIPCQEGYLQCLVSITSCQDWEITTIEKIGNRKDGYHPIQKTLAEFNGTQCGYCTPGWVMSMYSLLESNNYELTRSEIENSFGSNMCRCTGYRPILDAFKSFGSDTPKKDQVVDIEELAKCSRTGHLCSKTCDAAEEGWCLVGNEDVRQDQVIEINLKDKKKFFRVYEIKDVFGILEKEGLDSYMLVNGNTGKGAYPIFEYPRILIDISAIKDLKCYKIDQNLELGAGNTMTEIMKIFKQLSLQEEYFSYLYKFYQHLDLVAHIPVRNIGTIAGGLMLKHQHNDFPSDVFTLFETVKCSLTIADIKGGTSEVDLQTFLGTDMSGKIIVKVKLPPLSSKDLLVTHKIMPRSQNAVAQVNAGFLYRVDSDKETVLSARIVFGGLSPTFVHAGETENYLSGKKLFTNETLQGALKVMNQELLVEELPPQPSAEFRKKLAVGLFYKSLLQLCPTRLLDPRYLSGAKNFRQTRPESSGKQVYDTNKVIWPINEPIPKLESLIQCAGEAKYVNDVPTLTGEVFAAFVLTTVATGIIDQIDPSPALELEGVIAFYSAKDIPGINSYQSTALAFVFAEEEVLCDGNVKHYDMPLGIIVAKTDQLALRAAKLVKVTYKNVEKAPVITIEDAKKDTKKRVYLLLDFPALSKGLKVKKVFKGGNDIFGQYHFTMEPQSCVALPDEDGLTVYSATQWIDAVQQSIHEALKLDKNRINMTVTRLGGGYGSKISRSGQIAVACSLVSYLLNRPCRFVMTIEPNMRVVGKRLPCSLDFEVSVDDKGEIQHLTYNIYSDNGYVINEPLLLLGIPSVKNCYDRNRWHFRCFNVTTDTHSNSWCRSPGTLEAIAMTEYVMEQISYVMGLDPIDVRMANLSIKEITTKEIIKSLREDSEYDNRKRLVKKFNAENRWKKRGLRIVPISWPIPASAYYDALVSIYHGDGSVVITHGGVEMGQGINTKAAQVCAYTLNIPISKIKVKKSDAALSSNAILCGGSVASESVCFAVIKACQILLDRLAPIRVPLITWEQLVQAAYTQGILLHATFNTTVNDQIPYRVAGASLVEVELDMLTGEHEILRADVVEDVGQSLNPEVDVGQVEGAFVMGLGYWTSEHLLWDHKTGELLTNRTWDYHIPAAKDIPLDFRVKFRRNSFNPHGVLGSKATGEPASCMSLAVAFALREAIASSRADSRTPTTEWFRLDGPYTTERMLLAADAHLDEFLFY